MFGRKFKLFFLPACVGLFVLLIEKTGPATVAARVYDVGAGFLILILISGIRHLFRTAAWYNAIEREERQISFRILFGIRIAGEAISDLTFLGPLLGETVKGVTLSKHVAAEHCASSLAVENLAYGFSVGLLIVGGVVLFVSEYTLPTALHVGSLAALAILLLAGSAIGLVVKKRYRVVSKILDRLRRLNLCWLDCVQDKREKVILFEENVYGFWEAYKASAAIILLLEICAVFGGVIEAWIILALTVHRTSLFAAFIVEAVNRVVNMFFAFVPMRIGVDEGGAVLVLETVGYSAVEGVSLAVIRKIRTLFWVGVGLIMISRHSLSLKEGGEKSGSIVAASK